MRPDHRWVETVARGGLLDDPVKRSWEPGSADEAVIGLEPANRVGRRQQKGREMLPAYRAVSKPGKRLPGPEAGA